jgi:predicted nucleic acid-binding protein
LTVVLDANVAVALSLVDARAAAVERKLAEWRDAGEALHAPSLFRFEVANALTRSVVADLIDLADAEAAWQRITGMPIALHDLEDGPAAIEVAQRLQRKSAYDAAYVVLAQELGAILWTFDGPLARNASGVGLPVRLIDEQ